MRSGRGTKQLTGEVHPLLLLLLLLLLLHPTQLRSTWVTALVPAKGFTWDVGKEEDSFVCALNQKIVQRIVVGGGW